MNNNSSYQVALVHADVIDAEWGKALSILQDRINQWFEKNPKIELISVSHDYTALEPNGMYTAIIVYRAQA